MKHKYLIRNKYFSIYWRGSYCTVEIDIKIRYKVYTIQLLCIDKTFNYFVSDYGPQLKRFWNEQLKTFGDEDLTL